MRRSMIMGMALLLPGITWAQGAGSTATAPATEPKQYFAGWMLYNRFWFAHDRHAITIGGGAITNSGRYLVLVPSINGATAAPGTLYFTANPGDPYHAWDWSATYDYMPNQWITFWGEFNRRGANVPYFTGPRGRDSSWWQPGRPGFRGPGLDPGLSQDREPPQSCFASQVLSSA